MSNAYITNSRYRKVIRLTLPVITLIAVCAGCAGYHAGFLKHPQMRTVAIGEFENHTDEPALAILLRKKLAEQFSTRSALRLAEADSADILIRGNIRSYDTSRAAAAKVRDEEELPDKRTTYRTTIYNVKVKVDFETVIPSREMRQAISRRRVVGDGNFPEMPDLNTSRQTGLQQAVHDAAGKIVTAVTEAW